MATIVPTCLTSLTSIDGNDCIGDSRIFLNNNFLNVSNNLCNLYTAVSALTGILNTRITTLSSFVKSLSAKDSSTIDLTFDANSYVLSADIINNSLGTIKLGQDVTTFGKRLLTSTNIPLSSLAGVLLTGTAVIGQGLIWNGSVWTNGTLTQSISVINTGGGGSLSGLLVDRDYGDITVSNATLTWTIDNNAVTTTKIQDLNVTQDKISTGAISTSKLVSTPGSEAVTTQTIRDNAITTAKISAQAVTDTKIATDAVTTIKILDNNVTNAKLATVPAYSIKGNSAGSIATPTDIQATANTVLRYTAAGSFGFGQVPNEATTGTASSIGNTLVLRDTNGNFSASVVTASAAAFGFVGNLQGTALSADRANLATRALSADRAVLADLATRALSADIATDATKLQTARRFELSGVVLGSSNFNGTSTATFDTTFRSDIQDSLNLLNSLASFMGIRMSLSPESPITTTDIKDAIAFYLHPFGNSIVSLWDTTTNKWELRQFNTVLPVLLTSSGVPLAANTNYDVYLFFSTGSFRIEFVPWTSNVPPTISVQNGVPVRFMAPNKRLIGCIRTTNTGQTEVSFGRTAAQGGSHPKLFVWNYYNQQPASFSILERGTVASMNYWDSTSAGANAGINGPFEKFGGATAFGNKISFISRAPQVVTLNSVLYLANNAVCTYYGYSLDLETPTVAQLLTNTPGVPIIESCRDGAITQTYTNTTDPGYHYLQIISMTYAGQSQRYFTWTGDRHSYGTTGTIAAY